MNAAIRAIEYYLPERVLSNQDLANEFPDWSLRKIQGKTGIDERHIAEPGECSSDLAVAAAGKLFRSGACTPDEIDYLLLCTQSPDHFLPSTACLVQHRLGLPTRAGALDFNLGCSGFVYGLGMAHGLIATGQAMNVLLITAETYSKFIHPKDKSVRTIFGDAASATLLGRTAGDSMPAPVFVYGTDGGGAGNLIVPAGGLREPRTAKTGEETTDDNGNTRSRDNLFMAGPEVFNFTLDVVPACVDALLTRSGRTLESIDLFVFHQANQYMLEHLRAKLGIPTDKFFVFLEGCGNTVSSTIPIALKHAWDTERLRENQTVMVVGFGVGYSWGATLLSWPELGCVR